jgi:hypothetical protein
VRTKFADRGSGESDAKSLSFIGYISAAVDDSISLSLEPRYTISESNKLFQVDDLNTLIVPAVGTYHHDSGFFASAGISYYDQSGDDSGDDFSDSGFLLDGTIGFRLPNGRGVLALEVQNLLDTDVQFIQRDFDIRPENFAQTLLNDPLFAPERSIMLSATIRF